MYRFGGFLVLLRVDLVGLVAAGLIAAALHLGGTVLIGGFAGP